jgi:hypothetical protein
MIDPLLAKTIDTMYPPPTTPAVSVPAPTVAVASAAASTPAPVAQKRAPAPMRKKHPALSARILAVGLSTTALIGLTSGYTMAQRQPATQPIVQEPNISNAVVTVSGNNPGTAPQQKNNSATAANTPIASNSNQVIQVQVPDVAVAATPGVTTAPVYQPAQTQQKSSGSN